MKKDKVYIIVICILCLLSLIVVGCTSKNTTTSLGAKETDDVSMEEHNKQLKECLTEDEVIKAVSALKMFMKQQEVREIVGEEDRVVKINHETFVYEVTDNINVEISFLKAHQYTDYRLYKAFIVSNDIRKEIEIEYGELEKYTGLDIDETLVQIVPNHSCTYLTENNYYLVYCQYEEDKQSDFWIKLYRNQDLEYFDFDYIEEDEKKWGREYLEIEDENVWMAVYSFFDSYMLFMVFKYSNSQIAINDEFGEWQCMDNAEFNSFFRVVDELDKKYEIIITVNGEEKLTIRKNDIIGIVNK